MSTRVVGVRDLDGQFARMAAVKEACDTAGIGYPPELVKYFNHPGENIGWLRQKMETVDISVAVEEDTRNDNDIFTVTLAKLPPEVKAVRFVNSY